MNKDRAKRDSIYLSLGFVLFLIGVLVTTIIDDSQTFQVVGIILFMVAGGLFGASMSGLQKRKK